MPLPHLLAAIGGFNDKTRKLPANSSARDERVERNKVNHVDTRLHSSQLQNRVDAATTRDNLRVALYSHDTMGLGHLRRNLVIASALADSSLNATSLLITGAHEANFFSLPARADFLTLPRLHKSTVGAYSAGKLDISVDDLISLRADSICSALASFRPDVLVVDKVPLGAFGELLPALKFLRKRDSVKCVLGIRDILDDANVVHAETDNRTIHAAVDEFYDEIWVYGDQRVYDPITEYSWPQSVGAKVKFTGYLDQSRRLQERTNEGAESHSVLCDSSNRLIVCTLGGGQDGFAVAKAFVEALPREGITGILLTGPFMPKSDAAYINQIALDHPNLLVQEFNSEADSLINRADSVVTMGGYNSVCSVLSFGKRALVVPRVVPRKEQLVRAERLSQLGLIDLLHPDQLTTTAMNDWIMAKVVQAPKSSEMIDMRGLERVEQYCQSLVCRPIQPQAVYSMETK
jgi:predicted glycosyltransferase